MLVNIYRVVSVVHVIIDVICCGVTVGLCTLLDVTAAPSTLIRKRVSAPRSTYYTAWEEVLYADHRNTETSQALTLLAGFKVYGSFASWHFFESNHGKGPCDGIGGTTKRNADNAVTQGKVLIQDAHDFFARASQNEQGSRYELVTDEEYNNEKAEVANYDGK